MDRKTTLEQAMTIVCSDREKQYGSPENNFNLIARLWEDYKGYPFTAHDVAIMMLLLKVARIKTGHGKEDSYVNAAGYAACAAELADNKPPSCKRPEGKEVDAP